MTKRGAFEKDKAENSQNQLIQNMEIKFKKQLKDQVDQTSKSLAESEEKVKVLEKQCREMHTQI